MEIFENSIGIVNSKMVLIYQNNVRIRTKYVLKACIKEKRVFFMNFLFLFLSNLILSSVFTEYFIFKSELMLLLYFVIVIGTYTIKVTEFMMLIVCSDLSFNEVRITKKNSKSAVLFVEHINKLIHV